MQGLSVMRKGFVVLGKTLPMEIVKNKVAESGLITLDPGKLFPQKELVGFDLKDFLWQEMVLREKEFRLAMKNIDWSVYNGKLVALYCSTDAIVAQWAWMLVAGYLEEAGADYAFGQKEAVAENALISAIEKWEVAAYQGGKVIVKGCGDPNIGPAVYVAMSRRLLPVVQSLMYGEPCSTVPVFKKK